MLKKTLIGMGFLRIIVGLICAIVGLVLTFTIIGAIIGIPLLLVAFYLMYTERKNASKAAVQEGVKAALKDLGKD